MRPGSRLSSRLRHLGLCEGRIGALYPVKVLTCGPYIGVFHVRPRLFMALREFRKKEGNATHHCEVLCPDELWAHDQVEPRTIFVLLCMIPFCALRIAAAARLGDARPVSTAPLRSRCVPFAPPVTAERHDGKVPKQPRGGTEHAKRILQLYVTSVAVNVAHRGDI